jgi:hypothetical protein
MNLFFGDICEQDFHIAEQREIREKVETEIEYKLRYI